MADSYCESGRVPVSFVAPPCVPVCLVGAALRVLAYQLVLFRGGVAAATTPSAATARLTATTTRSSSVHPGRSISITHTRFRLQTHLGNDWEGTVVGAFSPVLDCRRTACVVYLIPPLMGTVVNLTGTSKRLNKQDRVKVLS
jgi:hypothetical protein